MEGYILNNSNKSRFIFKQSFPVGHKILLKNVWPLFEKKVCKELSSDNPSAEDFVEWLKVHKLIFPGFLVEFPKKATADMEIKEVTPSEVPENKGNPADGRISKPSLAGIRSGVVDKLTYKDIAELRMIDKPKEIIANINNVSKLRRSYQVVRNTPNKRQLERLLRSRIQELERL
jgi:hypothetical protein